MNDPLYCGIDAGGTSCRAVVASLDGKVRGIGFGPGGNPNHYGWEQTGTAMLMAVTEACFSAGASFPHILGIFAGVASVLTSNDRRELFSIARNWPLSPECSIGIDHDIRIALEGGLSGRPGIALIAGTGSSCYGRNAQGQSWQAGGWDQILDDLGSGYDLAQMGMAAACQHADGRGEATLLKDSFFSAFEVDNVADFTVKVHRPKKERHVIASLAPLVFKAAAAGDPVAQRLFAKGAAELARMVNAVITNLFPDRMPEIIFSGGLFENNSVYRQCVAETILEKFPNAVISSREAAPVVGALVLAAKACGRNGESLFLNHEIVQLQ